MVSHNDPVYNDLLEFRDEEAEITRTREFQFQREHHQLGCTDDAYLMAELSRRPHGFGAGWLAKQMALRLHVPPKDVLLITQGGHGHDFGHYDFSHVLEHIARRLLGMPGHEQNGINLILGRTQLPGKHWLPPAYEVLRAQERRGGNSPERLAALLTGGKAAEDAGLPPFYHEIISNPVCDCDRMDFLMRDSIVTGVKTGAAIEFTRIVKYLCTVDRAALGLEDHQFPQIGKGAHLGIDEKGLEAVRHVIEARRKMYETVYFHGITQEAETMLRKAVEMNLDVARPLMWGDDRLLDRLLEHGTGRTEELVLRIKAGYPELYPTALKVDPRKDKDSCEAQKVGRLQMDSRTIETELLRRTGLSQGDLLVSFTRYKDKGLQYFPVRTSSGKWYNIFDIRAVLEEYQEPSALSRFCVYAAPEHVGKARTAALEFLAEQP